MGNCFDGSTSGEMTVLSGGDSTRDLSLTHQLGPLPPYQESMSAYYPSPNVSQPAAQLTEEEQVKMAKWIGLIEHIPAVTYGGGEKNRECVICMMEFLEGDVIRYLPCIHTYHAQCIDAWLMRSFTCPSCMEPVDTALHTSFRTN
jgi:E3 ubiquitin-protein ligase RNF11